MVDDIKTPKKGKHADVEEITDDISEPAFVPPEQIADKEEVIDMSEENRTPKSTNSNKNPKKSSKLKAKIKDTIVGIKSWWKGRSKKQKALIIIIGLILLALISFGGYKLYKKLTYKAPPPTVQKVEEAPPPPPTTEPSKLTGVEIPIELNKLSVTGIMIENSPDARPQAGLKDAGVVFEAIAEGGITRFLALFQEAQPDYIGPVRSVRPYYLSWLQGFDAAVAHAGGSPAALAKIRSDGIKDLDHSGNGSTYNRVSNRYAPHNLYTSRAKLLEAEKSRGYGESNFTSFPRKQEKPLVPALAKAIDIKISSPLYNVHFDYDAASNSYLRSMGGLPHKDERSGIQITPKVVIALVIAQGIDPDGIHTSYQTIASGKAYIFQDGNVIDGNWSKTSDKDQIVFRDASGAPVQLNPGQTWITMTGLSTNVGYQP